MRFVDCLLEQMLIVACVPMKYDQHSLFLMIAFLSYMFSSQYLFTHTQVHVEIPTSITTSKETLLPISSIQKTLPSKLQSNISASAR